MLGQMLLLLFLLEQILLLRLHLPPRVLPMQVLPLLVPRGLGVPAPAGRLTSPDPRFSLQLPLHPAQLPLHTTDLFLHMLQLQANCSLRKPRKKSRSMVVTAEIRESCGCIERRMPWHMPKMQITAKRKCPGAVTLLYWRCLSCRETSVSLSVFMREMLFGLVVRRGLLPLLSWQLLLAFPILVLLRLPIHLLCLLPIHTLGTHSLEVEKQLFMVPPLAVRLLLRQPTMALQQLLTQRGCIPCTYSNAPSSLGLKAGT